MLDSDNAVVVTGIRKTFGSVVAVRDVSFEVGRGEVLGLLGPNGAGKTTTVDILSTLTRAGPRQRGRRRTRCRRRPRRGAPGDHADRPACGARRYADRPREPGDVRSPAGFEEVRGPSAGKDLLEQFDLVDASDRSVGQYSGGMRRRIDIACGLVVRPEVVFLDEPTTGLDPRSRQTIWQLVSHFKEQGIATLLTTQYLEEADLLSDRIVVIDHGTVIAEGTADALKDRTGGTYCEIVPRHIADIPAMCDALGSLLPQQNRDALTEESDRIAMPAPDGPNTLMRALHQLNAADIELLDVALRRPSLDEVFLALTSDDTRDASAQQRVAEDALA